MMGNMPGYLAEPECFGIKLVSLMPRNKPPLYSSHLASCFYLRASMAARCPPRRRRDHRDSHRCRERLATRLLACEDAGDLLCSGRVSRRSSHLAAMLRCGGCGGYESGRVTAQSGSFRGAEAREAPHHDRARRNRARGGRRCRHHLHGHEGARAHTSGDWLSPGVHLNVVGSSIAGTAEIDTRGGESRIFVDYRDSTIHEGGEYLRALRAEAIRPEHILAEIGEVANGTKAGRLARCDPVQIPGNCAAGSRLRSARAAESARAPHRASYKLVTPTGATDRRSGSM